MRFTIRDLLWLTVVVALGVGWWLERTQSNQLQDARAQVDKLRAANLKLSKERGELAHILGHLQSDDNDIRIRRFWDGARAVDDTLPTADEVLGRMESGETQPND